MSTHVIADPTATGTMSAPLRPDWWALSAGFTDEAPIIADRDDLIVTIAPGAGHGSPACFLPPHASIEIDGAHLGAVDPRTADPADPADRARYATAWGLFTHECAHAAHSRWDPPTGAPAGIAEAALLLEESRIEAAHLARRPDDRHWLRAATRNLILDDMPTTTTGMDTNSAARAAGLLLARRDAGVLDHSETTAITSVIHNILGTSTLDTLQQLWREAHTVADDDAETMLELGRRWCAALGTDPDTATHSGPDTTSASSSDGDRDGQADRSPLARIVQATTSLIAHHVADEPAPDGDTGPAAAQAAQQAADRTAQQQARTAAQQVFGRAPGGTPAGGTGTAGTRTPTTGERRAARTLARALSTAGVTERHTTRTTVATPPGRLRMRGALAADAQRAAGQIPTAEPFTRTHRRAAPAPPLTVGIACDASLSMQPYTGAVASAAWIVANATRHTSTPAQSATVLFGQHVHPLTHPGSAPRLVTTFDSEDCYHDIPRAIRALDGSLGLSQPGAARLLVILSDGVFEQDNYDQGQHVLDRLRAAGCGLLWLATDPDSRPMRGATVHQLTDPATTATVIGRAATAALRATARRH
ncbi:VWA domain-containing protein [Saccharopolyspora sp. HNM0986]|uniref:VWA domain-containing protein n=1 Tax=Saccharopolyspora galaxeae TaxID=2781241 RepID=UPI001909F885|nr:VWA domain-containing protein [Saccharopolyspora sp. HNM0986]MBK0870220.1 VWA domain-containing protein [Saccharopolyspora sp. HNM0986]